LLNSEDRQRNALGNFWEGLVGAGNSRIFLELHASLGGKGWAAKHQRKDSDFCMGPEILVN